MRQMLDAMGEIFDAAKHADVRVIPEITLTFNTIGDRFRFEKTMLVHTEPWLAHEMRRDRPPGEFELNGVVFKLAVKQVDAR